MKIVMQNISRCRRLNPLLAVAVFLLMPVFAHEAQAQESVRKERRAIKSGNSLYEEKKYREAAKLYNDALMANPESAVGRYNLGMAQIRQGLVPDTTKQTQEILAAGLDNLNKVASLGSKNSRVASLANFNLGNVAFNKEDYASAIKYYKQTLRLNPSDDAARRNLRIAQLKQQNQDKDNKDDKQNQDQNKDQNQEQNKDQNQNQDQNQDQNKNQNKDQQQPPKEQDINPQTADQILKAVENKENQTRNRVMRGQGSGQGKEKAGGNGGRKNW